MVYEFTYLIIDKEIWFKFLKNFRNLWIDQFVLFIELEFALSDMIYKFNSVFNSKLQKKGTAFIIDPLVVLKPDTVFLFF